MTTPNPCGECGLCCKLLAIQELGKPAGPWCGHFKRGCSIHDDRPASCRGFHCVWLKSQRLAIDSRLGPEWRPDRANFVMYTERDDRRLNVVVDPADPSAWKREPFYGFLKRMSVRAAEGHELLVFLDDRRTVVFPHEDLDLGRVKPGHQLVFGHEERDGQQVPYAKVVGEAGESAATLAPDT